jgi:hypothetical protein
MRLIGLARLVAASCLVIASADQSTEDREQSVRGWFLERTVFAVWIFDALRDTELGRHKYLYGISFGGLVLLNVNGRGASFDKAVIDSTPSRVSNMGCPEGYDPLRNAPGDGSKLLFITGGNDHVVKPSEQAELLSPRRVAPS